MTIVVVQNTALTANQGTPSPATANAGSSPTVGNALLVAIQYNGSGATALTITGVTDNATGGTNTYTLVKHVADVGTSGAQASTDLYWCSSLARTNAGTFTVSVAYTGGNAGPYGAVVNLMEVSGLGSTVDQTGSTDTAASPVTATAAGANGSANALVIALCTTQFGSNSISDPPSTGYSSWTISGATNFFNEAAYKIVSATETSSAQWTVGNPQRCEAIIATFDAGGATINTTTGTWSWTGNYSGIQNTGVGYPDTPRVSGPTVAGPSGFRLYPTASSGVTVITGIQGTWTWAPSTANFSIQGTQGTWTWSPSTATFSQLISGTQGTWTWSPSTASFSSLVSGTTGTWTWAKSTATFSSLLSTGTGTWTWAPSTATFNELLVTTTGTWTWNASTAAFTQLVSGTLGTWTWAPSVATFGGGATVINGTSGTNDWTWAASTATFPLETNTGTWSWGATTATFSALLSTTTGTWTWAASTANFTQLIAGTSGTNDWTWAPSTATFINGIPTINGISGINDWMWAGSQSIIVPGSIGHRGGDDAWRRKHRKEIFDDVDRRQRLREAITQAFGSEATRPEVQKYVRPVKAPTLRPVLNWDQIERNFEEIEQILPILQARAVRERELDQDDDDLMEVI